jgi:hypothetical protein
MCGYDMSWRRVDEAEEVAVAECRVLLGTACDARDLLPREEAGRFNRAKGDELGNWDAHEAFDGRTARFIAAQDQVDTAMSAMDDAQKSYFRLNISGMSRFAQLMGDLGMAFDDLPCPDWPDAEDFGLTDEQHWAFDCPEDYPEVVLTDEQRVAAEKLRAENDRVLSWHGMADTPGIPFHKFSTNDGWIVLPAECKAAVAIWARYCEDQGGEDKAVASIEGRVRNTGYWLKWIAFLDGAVKHDGFEVR